jgi:hypothetical protein
MGGSRNSGRFSFFPFGISSFCMLAAMFLAWQANELIASAKQQSKPSAEQASKSGQFSHGAKLILKDGTYQVVREYERNGDRVRYFSIERGDWEEIPAAMIDWDATAKDAAANQKASEALVEKVHKLEEARRMDNVADIASSLQVGNGAFLPESEGMFVVEGKSVRLLQQAGSGVKTDKLRVFEQIMSPVPIVPGKQKVFIPGAHSTLRLKSTTPEFYLREAPPDPDRVSPVIKSSRPGENGPEVLLIRAKVVRNGRELEAISKLFGQTMSTNMQEIAIQRWEVAPSVYRFTLGEALKPGEYALAEMLPDGLNFFVWDFGVDAGDGASTKK